MSSLANYLDDVDTDSIAASSGRPDPLPAGDYTIQLVEHEIKPTKDGTGIMLNAQYSVVDGEFEGRRVFGNFNIRNKSVQAQTIGIGQLKGLAEACGVSFEDVKHDVSLLSHIPFTAKIGFGKTTEAYPEPRNEIKAFRSAGAAAPPAGKPAPRPAARPVAASAPARSLPWKKPAAATEENIPF